MGIFRRHEQSGDTKPHEETTRKKDRFVIKTGRDGIVREHCWFCGREVEFDARNPKGEAAAVMIEPFGAGQALHGICHRACADRVKGSLAIE